MNDEKIIEYLRKRHQPQVEPPDDAVSVVMSAVDTARPQHSFVALLTRAAAVAAAASAVMVIALLLDSAPNAGPAPTATVDPLATTSASETTSPTPSPGPAAQSLLAPGSTAVLSATDSQGDWGTIRLERGPDLGGYRDADTPPNTFIIEVFVTYDAHRTPEPARFGASDWVVRPVDPEADGFFVADARRFERANGIGFRPELPLGEYPGAIDIFNTPTEGRVAFAVPVEAAGLALELVYQPQGSGEAFPIRVPGVAPDPVAISTPQPTVEPRYVEVTGLPITVLESADADALFSRPDTCVNPDDAYSVTFPDNWYTNTQVGDVPACSWFTPEFFEVTVPGETPEEIWIAIDVVDGVVAYTSLTEIHFREELSLAGREAHRAEYNPTPNSDPDFRAYRYAIRLADNGPTIVASTNTEAAADYHLAKAVLDRIMASFAFED